MLRDGKWRDIESHLLVPGDIVNVIAGSNVPADIILFEVNEMEVITMAEDRYRTC